MSFGVLWGHFVRAWARKCRSTTSANTPMALAGERVGRTKPPPPSLPPSLPPLSLPRRLGSWFFCFMSPLLRTKSHRIESGQRVGPTPEKRDEGPHSSMKGSAASGVPPSALATACSALGRAIKEVANARAQEIDSMRDHLLLQARSADRASVGAASLARDRARH